MNERLKRFRARNPSYDSDWSKKNRESINKTQRKMYARKNKTPIDWNAPWTKGLDEPMISPALIPKGYVQDWHEGAYKVRKSGRYVFLTQFPLIHFDSLGSRMLCSICNS